MASSADGGWKLDEKKPDLYDPETDYRGMADDSDVEQLPSPGSLSEASTADYWFGKKYFECVLAEDVFQRDSKDGSFSVIDSRLEKLIRDFPYQDMINSLQSGIPRLFRAEYQAAGSDGYCIVASLGGTINRIGTAQEKNFYLEAIRKHTDIKRQSSTAGPFLPPPTKTFTPPPRAFDRGAGPNKAVEKDVFTYTSRLKEYADVKGIKLNYRDAERVPENPDTFICILSFQGYTFDGYGRSKALAKHSASKEAWDFLRNQRESQQ